MTKIKVLIVRGGGYHDFQTCPAILKETYEDGGLATCDIRDRDNAFDSDISGYDCIAIYAQGGHLTSRQEKNICDFVASGKGLIGIHCASDSFVKNEKYMKMLGSHFISHAPGSPNFPVEVSKKEHPLAVRLKGFSITDEFYLLELKDDNLDIFMTANWQGRMAPFAYTKSYGKGRVFYTANGHNARVFRDPSFKLLAIRGLLFASGKWKEESKPIGFGLLGYGPSYGMGKRHGKQMIETGGLTPVAVCDIDSERLKAAQTDFPGIKTYTKLDKMLEDSAVSGVTVLLPHRYHAEAGLKIINSGRHVVTEKPFCILEKEADKIIESARKKKVCLTVYQNRRWDHHYLTAKKIIENGIIGTVFETQIDMGGYGYPGNTWRSDKKIAGGILYDWGAHVIDWMVNIVKERVVGVSGYCQNKMVWHMATIEDHFRIIIRFKNGAVANFCSSSIYAANKPGWIILGSHGGINFPNVFDEEATLSTLSDGKLIHTQEPCEKADWEAFYRNLADHLHHGVPLACRPEASARVIGIIEAAVRSAKIRKELDFKDKYFSPSIT